MVKEAFDKLSDDDKRDLVRSVLVDLIIRQKISPSLFDTILPSCDFEIVMIILGAYMNGEIN